MGHRMGRPGRGSGGGLRGGAAVVKRVGLATVARTWRWATWAAVRVGASARGRDQSRSRARGRGRSVSGVRGGCRRGRWPRAPRARRTRRNGRGRDHGRAQVRDPAIAVTAVAVTAICRGRLAVAAGVRVLRAWAVGVGIEGRMTAASVCSTRTAWRRPRAGRRRRVSWSSGPGRARSPRRLVLGPSRDRTPGPPEIDSVALSTMSDAVDDDVPPTSRSRSGRTISSAARGVPVTVSLQVPDRR